MEDGCNLKQVLEADAEALQTVWIDSQQHMSSWGVQTWWVMDFVFQWIFLAVASVLGCLTRMRISCQSFSHSVIPYQVLIIADIINEVPCHPKNVIKFEMQHFKLLSYFTGLPHGWQRIWQVFVQFLASFSQKILTTAMLLGILVFLYLMFFVIHILSILSSVWQLNWSPIVKHTTSRGNRWMIRKIIHND